MTMPSLEQVVTAINQVQSVVEVVSKKSLSHASDAGVKNAKSKT